MFKKDFNRNDLLKKIEFMKYWCRGMAIHNDIDGLVSGVYFAHKMKVPLLGILKINSQANMDSTIYQTDKIATNKIYIDCAMTRKNCMTIDHHSMLNELYNDDNINCNKYTIQSDVEVGNNFYKKNPTGNICWLLYIFGEDITNFTNNQLDLIILCDSLFSNYNKYKENCQAWLRAFGQEKLINYMEDNKNNIIKRMNDLNDYLGLYRQGYQIWDNDTHTFKSNVTGANTQDILDKISNIMKWDKLSIPNMKYKINLNNIKVPLYRSHEFIKNNLVVTNAIRSLKQDIYFCTYKNTEEII